MLDNVFRFASTAIEWIIALTLIQIFGHRFRRHLTELPWRTAVKITAVCAGSSIVALAVFLSTPPAAPIGRLSSVVLITAPAIAFIALFNTCAHSAALRRKRPVESDDQRDGIAEAEE